MLIAKLKNQIEINVNISPIKVEKRIIDSFYVRPLGYVLGAKESDFHIHFTKSKMVKKNPSSDVDGEGEMEEVFNEMKIFMSKLDETELSEWGTNDESLLEIFAKKYELEIDSFVEDGR